VKFAGLRVLPRQDMNNARIKRYQVALSNDDRDWHEVAKGAFDASGDEKEIGFTQPETARYLKFTALTAQTKDPFVAIAELAVIEAK
jgi:beta-galactosidase